MSEVKTREQVALEDTWDLALMYPTLADWEAELETAQSFPAAIAVWSGKLTSSPASLKEALAARFSSSRTIVKLYVYAHLLNDQDLDNSEGQDCFGRAQSLYYQFTAAAATTTAITTTTPSKISKQPFNLLFFFMA